MKLATLRGHGLSENRIFDAASPANRDNCFAPYIALRERLHELGYELNTADVNQGRDVAFELHQDVQAGAQSERDYLLLFETPLIRPENGDPQRWAQYRRVFTWNDALVDGERFLKFNFPNPLQTPVVDGWESRPDFCCLIAGNKAVARADERELYGERIRAIRWYERHAPADFALYGIDWDLPPALPGLMGKIVKRLWRYLSVLAGMKPFPSYRGKVARKHDVLLRTRFAICYENVRDLPGYITEKPFDCFFAGCVPVYWGAGNIEDHIPADCFIDRRRFADTAAVHAHLKAMTEDEFKGYQRRIADFLSGDRSYPFSSDFFAETVVNTIVRDLGRLP